MLLTEKYKNGEINKAYHKIRLYFPHEFISICKANGLRLLELLNEKSKNDNLMNSMRMWLIFKK